MVFKHRLAVAFLLASFVAAPRSAAADEDHPSGRTPLSQKEKLRWNVMMRDGKKLVEGEKWAEASVKFSEAIKLDPQPEPFLWKGFAEEKLGHLVVAKAIYAEALKVAKEGKLTQETGQAEEALAEITKKIPRIVVRIPAGVQATVILDSATITMPSEGADVDPGARAVDVTAPGREPYHADVTAAEGEVYNLDVPLPPSKTDVASPPPPVEAPRGCGACAVGSTGDRPSPLVLAALAALALSERRRSRASRAQRD